MSTGCGPWPPEVSSPPAEDIAAAAAEILAGRVPPPWSDRPRPSTREEAELIRASRSYRRLVKALAGRCP
jgi:hypothetical protein